MSCLCFVGKLEKVVEGFVLLLKVLFEYKVVLFLYVFLFVKIFLLVDVCIFFFFDIEMNKVF